MGCSVTAGRLRLGSLGLESDALGSPSALWARNRDNQLFRGLGRRRVRAETARRTFDRLEFGDGRDSSVDGSACSRRRQLEKLTDRRGPWWCVSVRTRTRLVSVYPRGDRSRGQFFFDKEVLNFEIDSERLASSCRCRAHGTLVVPAIVARRTPRLNTSLGNDAPLVDEEGYPYLVQRIELLVVSRRSPLALERCWRR